MKMSNWEINFFQVEVMAIWNEIICVSLLKKHKGIVVKTLT